MKEDLINVLLQQTNLVGNGRDHWIDMAMENFKSDQKPSKPTDTAMNSTMETLIKNYTSCIAVITHVALIPITYFWEQTGIMLQIAQRKSGKVTQQDVLLRKKKNLFKQHLKKVKQ